MSGGPTLRGTNAVISPPGPGYREDAAMTRFLADLLEPFGAKVDEDRWQRGRHVSHRALTDRLLEAEGLRTSRPQLIIVTHALPDVLPFTAVAPYLADRLGVTATTFSVAQQGLAAPFTALRIARAYLRSGRCEEAVIAVLEQTTLPTAHPLVDVCGLTDSGAALVIGTGSGPRLASVSSSGSVDELLEPHREEGVLVVLGPWVGKDAGTGLDVHRVEPGSYCTSVWLALAENGPAWQDRYRKVVLCDTDPLTGRSHAAVFEFPAG
ncbi:hypothetical protein [Amycolatopsis sp. SID8362]|uniref:hypothetical protein n=1 Tax=Amycolatopsis sp. SID8362 TaxID=2690346 RepID=UPI00137011FB|nr:hypothetical protein [Amycolatopsis sp. SID8362]NBH03211.1 hypothetical protein [Amycolatopsis sp. SID8362]NED39912.1 hypothetical protein [Amycolatopsis sp. SID8362]